MGKTSPTRLPIVGITYGKTSHSGERPMSSSRLLGDVDDGNTSCSHGWLRLVVQSIFAMITVASFILIVIMSMSTSSPRPSEESRCAVQGCRVVCTKAPYFGEYEDDIVFSLSEVKTTCETVTLTLNRPQFFNSTMPQTWLYRLRRSIHKLAIIGGNLKNITPQAFLTQFTGSIRCLVLEDLTITRWSANMLVGLSSLEDLCIRRCNIIDASRNALEAVDDTLKALTITMSGAWNPSNITGSTALRTLSTVIFSSNNFSNILGKHSFSRLRSCKVLHLNSCGITSVAKGTFDHLNRLEVLYLNNNFLVTVPPGLFDRLLSHSFRRARIDVQNNLWLCDCSSELRRLFVKNMFIVEPICHYPEKMRGKYFVDFYQTCIDVDDISRTFDVDYEHLFLNGACSDDGGVPTNTSVRLISPVDSLQCTANRIRSFDTFFTSIEYSNEMTDSDGSQVLKPTFALKIHHFSMIEITSTGIVNDDYGILWFQSKCPNEIFCISVLPNFLRVYNLDMYAKYNFCPLLLSTGRIEADKCISYSLLGSNDVDVASVTLRISLYICTIITCLIFGALCVYAIIRKFPFLLKGSKRILLVKHKNVDALILPPKVPLRNSLFNDEGVQDVNDKDIFIIPDSHKPLSGNKFMRTKSSRSGKSMAPSYISALQPTEDQLAEWRLRHLDNISVITSMSSPPSSWTADENFIYYSLSQNSSPTYESLH